MPAKKKSTIQVRVKEKTPRPAPPPPPIKKIKLEINTDKLEESIRQVVEKVQYWYSQGMIHKIRLKYRGKAILPDIPLSYFMLVQVATFFLTGVVRALAMGLGTRIFFEIEMINDAEDMFKRARDLYLDGDMDEAIEMLNGVLKLDKNYAEAHLYLGIIHRIRGHQSEAKRFFQQALKLNPTGKIGAEAAKNLQKMASSVD